MGKMSPVLGERVGDTLRIWNVGKRNVAEKFYSVVERKSGERI